MAGLDGTVAFPAAKTTTMPAARSAARSGWNAVWQPAAGSPQLAFTTAGASAVSGSPSGSSTHWKAAWTALAEARQRVVEDARRDQLRLGRHAGGERRIVGAAGDHPADAGAVAGAAVRRRRPAPA